jgi:hypothetical protein
VAIWKKPSICGGNFDKAGVNDHAHQDSGVVANAFNVPTALAIRKPSHGVTIGLPSVLSNSRTGRVTVLPTIGKTKTDGSVRVRFNDLTQQDLQWRRKDKNQKPKHRRQCNPDRQCDLP